MKKIGKILLRLIIGLIVLIGILYGAVFLGHRVFFQMPHTTEATIPVLGEGDFAFGAASRQQPKTTEEYIKVLAQQVKSYNEKTSTLWPNNTETNQLLIAQDIKTKKIYRIEPDGRYKTITSDELDKLGGRQMKLNGDWAQLKKDGASGAVVAVDPAALTNYYTFQRYEHLGTYDPFITYAHELFHAIPQETWKKTTYGNTERDERLDDSAARRTRMLLQQQLTLAISDPPNREAHIKDALATYKAYQKNDQKDYQATLLSDRLEGTAYYYELKASLYAGYPDTIKTDDDIYRALSVILKDDNPAYRDSGATIEGYAIGGYSAILLDLLAKEQNQDPNSWKKTIEENGETTSLTLLEQKFENTPLPEAKAIPSEKKYKEWLKHTDNINPKGNGPENIFNLAYGILY